MTTTTAKALVINADDFGLTPGVCTGILRGHEQGVVTSTSVLAPAPAFARHAAALRDSGLAAGLHLCLVGEDPPVLCADEIPTLVDRTGRFPASWRAFCMQAIRGRVDPGDVERELRAQADVVLDRGVELSHVDAHQYIHLWPSVGRIAVAIATDLEVPAIRVPDTQRRTPVSAAVRRLAAMLRREVRDAGLIAPDAATGLDQAGSMTLDHLQQAIDRIGRGPGIADITVHPGESDDPARHRYDWGFSWPVELAALCSGEAADAVEHAGFILTDYHRLAGHQPDQPLG